MANEDQAPNTFAHGETDVFRTNIDEASKVIEDTEMANVEETPSLDDKPVDAVMGLWYLVPHKNSSQSYKNEQSV
ncbi:hypothetical protein G6F31_021524 [Rhizopus arrhizus]|nr:hypothetical protein G6F24_017781 [Rhizopus arrhizus]KAG0911196.1 hypothetical protein G6F31_021524 [Rhizopus arrhizus]